MSPLVPKTRFEDIVAEVDKELYIKLEDRSAKNVIESPGFALFDDDEFQRRHALVQVKQAEIKELAQKTGAPQQLLKERQSKKSQGLTRYRTSQTSRWPKLCIWEYTKPVKN